MKRPAGLRCTICNHPARPQIDLATSTGVSKRAVAERFGISRDDPCVGMRKRTSLIRTLVYDPPVILMDEPFGALDAQTRTQLQADLLRLWNLGRKTIIFVTHDAFVMSKVDEVLDLSSQQAAAIAPGMVSTAIR